jgi:endonuclease/exonuclease/phosphatase (EEP) superfamily protein YafD
LPIVFFMKVTLIVCSIFLLLIGLAPLVKNEKWIFRIFDYPRVQKLILCLLLISGWILTGAYTIDTIGYILCSMLLIMAIYLIYQIYPYTPLGIRMVQTTPTQSSNENFMVLVINVYQYNTSYEKVISLIKKEQPDFFLLVETDLKWAKAIGTFKNDYPYWVEKPLDTTYGMLFYSRLPILENKINFLIDPEIPSLETLLQLKDGQLTKVFSIHPMPPVPQENPRSTERDAEILLVGKMVKAYKKPAIVLGDLNDVGWSFTSELFLKTSGMLDPRRGRGMYNTFNARYFFLRWPLDHIFVTKHFTLDQLQVHNNVGSDHFPISARFTLEKENLNKILDSDREAEATAKKKIESGLETNKN